MAVEPGIDVGADVGVTGVTAVVLFTVLFTFLLTTGRAPPIFFFAGIAAFDPLSEGTTTSSSFGKLAI